MAEEQVIAALDGRGVDLGIAPSESLEEALDEGDGLVMLLADGRWVSLPALLAGRVFTHRLTGWEVDHDVLAVNPDLGPIAALPESKAYQHLADGSLLTSVFRPFDADTLEGRGVPLDVIDDDFALLLTPGRLKGMGVGEGDVVALRLTTAGLTLEAVAEPATTPEVLAELGRRLDAVLQTGQPVELDVAIWTACADSPMLFGEPLPPLSAVLDQCGLSRYGDWLATQGFDFQRWRIEKQCAAVAREHELSDNEALAVLAMVTLYDQVALLYTAALAAKDDGDETTPADSAAELSRWPESQAFTGGEGGDRVTVKATVAYLAEPAIAEAVLAETIGTGSEGAAALGLFAETLEPLAPRDARPGLLWLRAKAYERLGHVAEAEATYQVAESMDPDWPLTLADLARYAGDRGDAERGLALLRRAGIPRDHAWVELLERFHAPPRPGLGRNQPCWCGSGRKYKKCHLGREQLPLAERAAWLYQKAGMFITDGPWHDLMIEVATERAQYADSPQAMRGAVGDPLVGDAVLFEGGAFADFVATRGGLLPDDERLLAEQWLLIERSVYEVEHVRRGHGFTMRDLRTGDIHQVLEHTASRQVNAGTMVCCRVVPAGDTTQIFGGLEPVALHERDELTALLDAGPEPLELVAFLTRRFAPPALTNTEGEPMVLCDATLRVNDPAALTATLDETYQCDEDSETPQWFEHVTTHGMERIRAVLRLEHDELHVNTNSEVRFDRVLDTLRKHGPLLTVVNESRRPIRDAREAAEFAARSPQRRDGAFLDPADPGVAAALEEFIRDYEQKWLDEPIPALAGYTPRAAAADPTRREDLKRLLDSFPADDSNPGAMNSDRLRAALDLN